MGHPVNDAVNDVVVHGILNQPRSQQTLIGPSEIGTDCIRCLARKLAGVPRIPGQGLDDVPWLPAIGTAVHSLLEGFLEADNQKRPSPRWLIENRVSVGKIGDNEITGSCDLFDLETNTVIDHKVVGATKLRDVPKKGPGAMYRVQAHLYGLGWKNAGYEVNEVAVKFYPRNHVSLAAGFFWSEPYNEQIAIAAMERANEVYTAVSALKSSEEGLKVYFKSLPTASGCFSCSEYPSLEDEVEQPFDDLFSQPASFNRR